MGVDLISDEFYKEGFVYFYKCLNEWIKLGDEIFVKLKVKK